MAGKKEIEEFYGNKRIAVVGASGNKHKYGNMLFSELKKQGYDIVPVNPNTAEVEGVKTFAKLTDIPGGIEAAFVVVQPHLQDSIARDAAKAGVKTLWIHEHVMKGISNTEAIAVCVQNRIKCIAGRCPMMFMPGAGFPHSMHKGLMGLFGALPE